MFDSAQIILWNLGNLYAPIDKYRFNSFRFYPVVFIRHTSRNFTPMEGCIN